MFRSNPGTSQGQQQQALARHRELNAANSRKIRLEEILVAVKYRYDHDRDRDPTKTETVIPVVRVLRDLVKVCDELINYQGQDEDKIQNYKTEKKSFEEALTKIVLTREQSLSLAHLRVMGSEKALEIAKSHYALACDTDRQQTVIPLVKALRDLAEACGEFGKYQEQDKNKLTIYTKQKEILETALAISRKDADHEKIVEMLREWGKSNYSLKDFDKKNLEKEGIYPIEDAQTFHKLGNVHYCLKDLNREKEHSEKAKEYYQKALGINKRISHIGNIEVAHMLNNLGSIDHASENYQTAKKNFEEALPIFKKLNGSDDINVGVVLNNLGHVHRDLKNHEEAKKSFEKALPIYKKVHGPEHIEVGIMLNKLGDIDYSLKNFNEAKNSHESALPIYEKFYRPNHVKVAEVLDNLGDDYLTLGNKQEAKKIHERMLLIYKRDLAIKERRNPDSIEVAEALCNVGSTYYNLDDLQNRIIFSKREVEIRKRHYESYTTEVVDRYRANMFSKTNVPYIHVEVLEENYRKEKISRGIEVAKASDNLGNIYLALGDHKKAEVSYKDALEHYGPDHPSAVKTSEKLKKTTVSLTKSLIEQLKKTLAEKEGRDSTNDFLVGLTLRDLVDAYGVLANTYGKLNDDKNKNESLENQKRLLKKALPILKKTSNPSIARFNELADKLGVNPNSALDSTSTQAASSRGSSR